MNLLVWVIGTKTESSAGVVNTNPDLTSEPSPTCTSEFPILLPGGHCPQVAKSFLILLSWYFNSSTTVLQLIAHGFFVLFCFLYVWPSFLSLIKSKRHLQNLFRCLLPSKNKLPCAQICIELTLKLCFLAPAVLALNPKTEECTS